MAVVQLHYKAYWAPAFAGNGAVVAQVELATPAAMGSVFALFEDTAALGYPLISFGIGRDAICCGALHRLLNVFLVDALKTQSLQELRGAVTSQGLVFKSTASEVFGRFGCPAFPYIAPSSLLLFALNVVSLEPKDPDMAVEKEKDNFQSIKCEKKSVEEIVALAEQLKERGNALIKEASKARPFYLQAIDLLESFLASWELDHAPLTDLPAGGSNCEIKKEMRGEKIDQKERSLMDEKLATYYLNLAHCEIELNNPSSALACCNLVLNGDPSNPKAHYRSGIVYEKCNYVSAAKWHFTQSNILSPTLLSKKKVEALREKEEKEKEARRKKLFEGMFAGAEVAQRRLKF